MMLLGLPFGASLGKGYEARESRQGLRGSKISAGEYGSQNSLI